ncbi:MAG: hypothetical protein KDA69_17395 [Planctomycetaceae bacterium]|nr:hypothetical protein [Planctomycetaceae bacterium]
MKPLDYVKAAGLAFVLLVVNVLIAFLVVFVYAAFIEPGHPSEFYEQAALRIVPWSCHILGTPLFFFSVLLLTARCPRRNSYLFATAVVAMYALLDAASVGFSGVFDIYFALSMLLKLAATLAAAHLGGRWRLQGTIKSEE